APGHAAAVLSPSPRRSGRRLAAFWLLAAAWGSPQRARYTHDIAIRWVYRRALPVGQPHIAEQGRRRPVHNSMTDSLGASAGSDGPIAGSAEARPHTGFWGLALGSIGVVYGDIG